MYIYIYVWFLLQERPQAASRGMLAPGLPLLWRTWRGPSHHLRNVVLVAQSSETNWSYLFSFPLLLAMAARTAEVLGIVLGSRLVDVNSTETRMELVPVNKNVNRDVRRALMLCHADFHRRYPEIRLHFFHCISVSESDHKCLNRTIRRCVA